MKIKVLTVGKLKEKFLYEGIEFYRKRINFYVPFEIIEITDIKNSKNLDPNEIKDKEAEKILSYIKNSDYIISLDEKGQEYTSVDFSMHFQSLMNKSVKEINFVIGGSYGLSDKILKISNEKISLSKMTFPHDLVRLIFVEQLYRALTIINNEKYHH